MPQRLPQLCCNVDGKFPPPQSIHLKFTLFFDLQLVQYKFLCFYFACVCVYKYFGGTPRYYIFVNKNKNWRFWKNSFTGLLELMKPYKIKPIRDFIIFREFPKLNLGFLLSLVSFAFRKCANCELENKTSAKLSHLFIIFQKAGRK